MTKELFSFLSTMFVLWHRLWFGMLAIQFLRYCDAAKGNPAENSLRTAVPRLRRLDGPYGFGYGRYGFQGSYGVPLPQPGYVGKVPGFYTRPPGVTLLPTNTGVMFPTTVLGGMASQAVYSANYSASNGLAATFGGTSPIVPVMPDLLVIANRLKEKNIGNRQAAILFLQEDSEFKECSASSLASIVDIENLAEYLRLSKVEKTEDAVWKKIRSISQLKPCSDDEVYALSRQPSIKSIYDAGPQQSGTQRLDSFSETADDDLKTPMDAGAQEWCHLQPNHPLCRK
ncbi:hypothetical protein TGPRC2_278680 [Toxoplasma gondii TgCatPRC2]|uniref:Uncharacterized protein n=9 Tax=Toxoplasma gondii TaxID=5811 RepID=A0A125YGG9_TOXGV|nr:hypothetical protein TGME49_278680 [Toxoplasma gondii ME49]EPR63170.1 hypothetical protein TGGT1_278680 [Toxoplasma gondii GT1]ESS34629.1 hypothetical protein TGVEG_278680 [Toxoplasma gondii VEG]KAF4638911.1 hypothetical protein TGRH88_065200 [Toxoplasma gondii]KFG34623.1 hypothetical protein TGDOM2_278680 [Toxoplasma gondii GAB2-2007-GAL-DOM2]KFG46189.1 hypothetical protein TGFOU_278680 [Toxoplasma gondii FOU]KFG58536.1 hypothetical protein TGRUB_278680 [Toxoplasma gondii RUB]KFH09262.1 |eukprot:XP_018635120.1 hypothetical protein TGME49_278680 [Toxoplasma gondii ME49]